MKLQDFEKLLEMQDRREQPRSEVNDALHVMTNHMYAIKRALDSNNIKQASGLVDGAIRAFSQGRKPFE